MTSRWLVWLGGIALSLSGIFLVKYSIENALLGPAARVIAGTVMALAMIAAGEWLRRRAIRSADSDAAADFVPASLTAAGIAVAFGSIYAAYGLYALISPVLAFLLLAMIGVAGVGLSLVHGIYVAAVGLAGAYAVPALVRSDDPSALALFGYLLVINTSAMLVVRFKAWWWLGGCVLAAALAWPLIWFETAWRPADAPPVAVYLLLLCGMIFYVRPAVGVDRSTKNSPFRFIGMTLSDGFVVMANIAVAVVIFALVRQDGHGYMTLFAVAAFCLLLFFIAYREAELDGLPILSAALVLAVLATWNLTGALNLQSWYQFGGVFNEPRQGPAVPPGLPPIAVAAILFGALFGAIGYLGLWRARRPAMWAAISSAVPLLTLIVLYWRIKEFDVDLGWASIGLGLAGLALAAAAYLGRFRSVPGMDAALGAYAVGVVAALALAATMALQRAWLTVALSLLPPAIAWIEKRLQLAGLRNTALVFASIVVIRLVFNVNILAYPVGDVPGVNWILYGYGIPAAAFFLGARWFRDRGDDRLVTTLECGALIFAVLFVSLEIRILVGDGRLDHAGYRLLEQSLHSITWLAAAYGLYRQYRVSRRQVQLWGWRVLGGMAVAQIVLLQCGLFNPLLTGNSVWEVPILNVLFFAYAMPAFFSFLFFREARSQGDRRIMEISGFFTLALLFIYLSLEVRHAFHGAYLRHGWASDAEWYSYSFAWLVYAGTLLAVGIRRIIPALRYASLLIIMIVVAKVFLFDLGNLTGLYRVASFLALGLSLVGVGYLYQRYVFPKVLSAQSRDLEA